MSQKIRIKDIATKAGVSPGTVDRVLHKRGNVSAKAREKVMAALEKMDYSPNVLASALAYNKIWKVAAIIPREDKDPFWMQPKEGIQKALKVVKDYGLALDFYQFYENDVNDFKVQSQSILESSYDAVIIAPLFREESLHFMEECQAKGIAFVQINTNLDTNFDKQLCYIGQDSYHSGVLGAKLLAFGLTSGEKVMIAHLEELVYNSQHLIDKEQGFKDYFANHPSQKIEVVTGHFVNPYHHKGLVAFFKDHLTKHPTLKGIFITTSRAFHVANAMKALGRDDLKIVGYDLIEPNLKFLDTDEINFLINQNPFKQGFLAMINIFNHLLRKIEPEKVQHLPLDVVMKENVSYYSKNKTDSVPIVL